MNRQSIVDFYNSAPRAVDELRRQMGFFVETGKETLAVFPAEYLSAQSLGAFKKLARGGLSLLITGARAESLGLKGSGRPVSIDASSLPLKTIHSLANPTLPCDARKLRLSEAPPAAGEMLTLVKHASLLPALLIMKPRAKTAEKKLGAWIGYRLSISDLKRYAASPAVELVETARARLPIEGAENNILISYCSRHCVSTHLALVVGDISKDKAPLTRVHSSCVTGDILGSLRCDCGDQLQMAIDCIAREGSGILLYLHQEGRGIGITNKLRAYALQEQGVDTYEANRMLGFEEDERDFSIAAAILKKLGVKRIRMLTNNPSKMRGVDRLGIKITERVPLVAKSGKHSHAYLTAKGKAGHQF